MGIYFIKLETTTASMNAVWLTLKWCAWKNCCYEQGKYQFIAYKYLVKTSRAIYFKQQPVVQIQNI